MCFYPLARYLADNVLGRYKIIKASLIIFIIACIVVLIPIAVSIVLFTESNPEWGCHLTLCQQNIGCDVGVIGIFTVQILFYITISISFIGFNANIANSIWYGSAS